jgi:hypothetical protein
MDHGGFADAWNDVQRPPILPPPQFAGSEAHFNDFERIYDAPPVQPTWDGVHFLHLFSFYFFYEILSCYLINSSGI